MVKYPIKKNNNNKTIKQKCAETGKKQENVNTEKNANMPMVITNYNPKKMFLNTIKQETVNYFTKKEPVLMEQDVYLYMYIKTNQMKFLKTIKLDSQPNYNTELLKKKNNPDSHLLNPNKNNNLKNNKLNLTNNS